MQAHSGFRFDQRPFILFWEVTRACALACRHCRASAVRCRHPQELSTEEARTFLDQVAALAPPMFVLTGGDPLMRPDLFEIIEESAKVRSLRTSLSPSATPRLSRTDFSKLKEAGIERLSLSLDGATRESHDRFRGVPHTFDRTIEAVRQAHEAGIPLQINTTLHRGNTGEFEAFADLMFVLRPAMWSLFLIVPTGRAALEDLPDSDEVERILVRLHEISKVAPFEVKTTEGHHYRRIVAQREAGLGRMSKRAPLGIRDGRGVAFVSHTGEVSPSGFLPRVAGNVRHVHLRDLYRHHPLFVSLRDSDRLLGKCGRCEFRNLCGGSRARAFAVHGDMFAEEPLCNYQPYETDS